MQVFVFRISVLLLLGSLTLAGCSGLPGVGFLRNAVEPSVGEPKLGGIQFVEITEPVARKLLEQRKTKGFADTLGAKVVNTERFAPGDIIEVSIWEAPPASLFTGVIDAKGVASPARVTTFPEQMISNDGVVNVPFAGQVPVAGRLSTEVETEIIRRLKGIANQPQVLVRRIRNLSSDVTIVGEVPNSTRIPLTPRGEKLLDALAAAGGVRQPVNKMTLQVTRGRNVYSMPLEAVIKDPNQNVPLQPGDVLTALFQPNSFIALGASGKNEEVNFEAQGITLSQALARAGGLIDTRADALGVFIFRFESKDALPWPKEPVATTPEGKVPVIYRANLNDPATFFVAQSFHMNDKDVMYVSNASLAELQKFLNILSTVLYPLAIFRSVTN